MSGIKNEHFDEINGQSDDPGPLDYIQDQLSDDNGYQEWSDQLEQKFNEQFKGE